MTYTTEAIAEHIHGEAEDEAGRRDDIRHYGRDEYIRHYLSHEFSLLLSCFPAFRTT
jgi:hypothetical protein